VLAFVVGTASLLGAAAPGSPPDFPAVFITVDALKAAVDRGADVVIVDVRTRQEFDELHIAGARSIPLRSLPDRTTEIPRDRLVVFY
jgi:rhodanese-related sulfurtransferase